MTGKEGFFIGMCTGLVIYGLFAVWLLSIKEVSTQQIAIDANVARWVIDGKTGERALEYGCDD